MDAKIQEVINILNNIKIETDRIKEIGADYQSPSVPHIQFNGKISMLDSQSNRYVKVETLTDALLRLRLFYKAMQADVSEIFLPENILLQTDEFCATSQECVPLWGEEYSEEYKPDKILYNNQLALSCRLNQDYPDKYNNIYNFFEQYQLQGIHGENAGTDANNKLKIFDWFGNYWIDSNGELFVNETN